MSEPVAKSRPPVDLGEFERRLRGPERPRASHDDPLAELARLVDKGHSQHGGNATQAHLNLKPPAAAAPEFQPSADIDYRHVQPTHSAHVEPGARLPRAEWQPPLGGWEDEKGQTFGGAAGANAVEPVDFHNDHGKPREDFGKPREDFENRGEHTIHDEHREGMAATDARFEGDQANPAYPYDELPPPPPPQQQAPRRSRTGAYAMAGALGVVALGVAGTFAMKSGPTASRDTPVIKAATGPAKVQPEGANSAAPSQMASVLDKGNERLTTSKVVGSVEQPVDIGAQIRQPRAGAPAGSGAAPAGNSIFPEPKRVKTVSVRPDGSIISADIPVATTTPAPQPRAQVATAIPGIQARPVVPNPVTTPAPTPKATARVAARTPGPAEDDDDAPVTKPAAKPTAKPAPKPSVRTAVDPKPAGGGGFSVQMGVAGSDAEARAKASQVQARFGSNLGGHRATVVKGEVNGKTVYRVRVVGLSQEGAADMCSKVKGGGGDCFVAR